MKDYCDGLTIPALKLRISEMETQHTEQLRKVAEAVRELACECAMTFDPTARAAGRIDDIDLSAVIAEAVKP